MKTAENSTQWAADCAVAEKEKISVCDVANRRESATISREILPGTIAEIDRDLEAAEAARIAALQKESAVESIDGQWDRPLDTKLHVERELTLGEQRIANLDVEGRVQFIGSNLGAEDN